MSLSKNIDELIADIKNPEHAQPILAGRKLKKYVTPEVGWLLMQMHAQARVIYITAPDSSRYRTAKKYIISAIETIAADGRDARSLSGNKKLNYYRKLAKYAMKVDNQALGAHTRREPIEGERVVAKPTVKGYDQMIADRRLMRKLEKTHKRGGTSVALLYQAKAALDVSYGQLDSIKSAVRVAQARGESISDLASSELVVLARTLEESTIPSQEKAVRHLSKIVDASLEVEAAVKRRILNKRLQESTKALMGDMKRVKTVDGEDSGDRNASLSLETLNAYEEISEHEKALAALGNEAYLKRLMGD